MRGKSLEFLKALVSKSRVVLLAHMDEIGFIIHFISDEGLLYFSPIGGHDSVVFAGQRVWVHGRGKTTGVIGRAEFNLMTSEKKDARPELGELWIDIGARSQSEAEDHVAVGDVVTFQYEFQKLLGDRAASRAFDNKAGLWAIAEALRLLKEDGGLSPDVGVYAVATVQEEIGSRGAEVATRSVSPQSGLAIDVGYARDHSAIDKRRSGQLEMGKGPGIACGPNANRMVFEILRSAAEDEKNAAPSHGLFHSSTHGWKGPPNQRSGCRHRAHRNPPPLHAHHARWFAYKT